MHVRPELTGRRAPGRRGLQGVPAFDRTVAIVAPADMHFEAAVNDAARNLRLILPGDVRRVQVRSTAVWADGRQRHVVGFVDPGRNAAVGMRAMTPARLAAWLLPLGRRLVLFAKRRGLAFTFAAQLFHEAFQLLDPSKRSLQLLLELADLFQQFLVRRPPRSVEIRFVSCRAHTDYTTRGKLAAHNQLIKIRRPR